MPLELAISSDISNNTESFILMCRCAEMVDRNISDVESKPLWVLKSSLIEISKMLDAKKCLRTEGDYLFRDWRGPQDIANEGRHGSDRIVVDPNSSKSKTCKMQRG